MRELAIHGNAVKFIMAVYMLSNRLGTRDYFRKRKVRAKGNLQLG